MLHRYFLPALALTVLAGLPALAQTALKDPQAVVLTTKAVSALNGTTSVTDVAVQAAVTYIAGSDVETGTATLEGHVGNQARIVLSLSGGQRQEVRNGPTGAWAGPDGTWYAMATHNCFAASDWFFPVLTLQAVLADPNWNAVYVGQENFAGRPAYHIQLSHTVSGQQPGVTAIIQRLSALDLYLDAASSLPLRIVFNTHPDDDVGLDLPVEIQFSDYKTVNGIQVPFRIQKLIRGGLQLDLVLTSAAINSGLSSGEFTVPAITGCAQ